MLQSLPTDPQTILAWDWSNFSPYYQTLQATPLTQDNLEEWVSDWAKLYEVSYEQFSRLSVAVSINTADTQAETRYKTFFDEIYPKVMEAEQELKQKLLDSGLEPAGYTIPMRNMRAEADLYRQENLSILAAESKLKIEYDKVVGAQTIIWEGQEQTVEQISPVYQDSDRARRETAWRMVAQRQLSDRSAISQIWKQLLDLRCQLAANAGRPDYRSYRWQELLRFDYTPADARSFQDAIEEVVVPAASRIYEQRRQKLGVDRLRPWDLVVDRFGLPPLRPFQHIDELKAGVSHIFHRVDPQLGEYFDRLDAENLMDLENRKNKAPGAYCTDYPIAQRPFVFENAVGLHSDVQTLLHESGHAFHVFESITLPSHLRNVPTEFAEVASMGMELLASPYLLADQGGFYTTPEAARARIEHLEGSILFWPYMAVVDAFQHWVYENPAAAAEPANCDAFWAQLWGRFMPGVDWTGLEQEMMTGWQRKQHIHTYPFYYIEYGLAQLGAVQVWGNSLKDQAAAVAAYRRALAQGGRVSLPELFETAGARFGFDAGILREAVILIEDTIHNLEEILAAQ